jgi:hypothetical protein
VFLFSLELLSETFLILRRTEGNIIINVQWALCKVPVVFFKTLVKLEFSRDIFEKLSNFKFHENPSRGNRVLLMRTDGHDEDIVTFRNFANTTKNCNFTLP